MKVIRRNISLLFATIMATSLIGCGMLQSNASPPPTKTYDSGCAWIKLLLINPTVDEAKTMPTNTLDGIVKQHKAYVQNCVVPK